MWVSGHTPLCMSGDQRSRFFSFRHVGVRNGASVVRLEAAPLPAEPLSSVQLRCLTVCFYSLFLVIGSDIDFLFILATEFLFKIVHISFESVN